MGKYIKKHRHQFAGVALPLFALFILGWIGVSVFPGWISPTFGTLGLPCTIQATDSSDPLLTNCNTCMGEFCSFPVSQSPGICSPAFRGLPCPGCQCGTVINSTGGPIFFPSVTCGAPDDAFCQDISGGDATNDCRVGVCTTNTNFDSGNPSGCDFTFDTGNIDCVNCAPPTDPSINCGNGVCEPGDGETFDSCFADCQAPGFPFDSPFPEDADQNNPINRACTNPSLTFIQFSGNVVGGDTCEDGDVCTTNVCGMLVTGQPVCEVDPAVCDATAPDFCCPVGCNPPPNGPGTCDVQLDPNCDDDCLPPQDCEPSPSPIPSASPFFPVLPLEISGTSPICSLADRGPSGGMKSVLSLMSLPLGLGLLLAVRKRAAG